ncbi:MAG: DUF2267 domain-containing protein [Elainellaceae cyanobacterium]
MKYNDILERVQTVAQIDQPGAQKALEATLKTLAERILGNEASHLAAQLPDEVGTYLKGHEGENGQPFNIDEFYQRVAQKEGVDGATAAAHVRAVFIVLQEAVTPGEFSDVKVNLSDDYQALFAPASA